MITAAAVLFLVVPNAPLMSQDNADGVGRGGEASRPGEGVDASMSHLYARYAYTALEEGRHDEAAELAERSLEFFSDNPDALHIRARTMLPRQERTARVLSDLEAALAGGERFRVTAERTARRVLVETYLRVGRYSDALSLLSELSDGMPPEPGTENAAIERIDATLQYLRARALLGLGRVEEAEQVAQMGRNRFPDDPRFFLFLLRRDPIPGPQSGQWIDEHVSRDPAYLKALLYYAERTGNLSRKQALAERYLRLGGDDPSVAALMAEVAARQGRENELRASWRRFVDLGGMTDKTAVERMFEILPEGEVKSRARHVLSRYDGVLDTDDERDGYWEERFYFEDGELRRWVVDRNQDGELDYDIEMADRVPQSVRLTPEGFRVVYGSYPEISHVLVTDENEFRRYLLVPGTLTYDILDDRSDWSEDTPGPAYEFSPASAPPILGEEILRRHAYRLEVGETEADRDADANADSNADTGAEADTDVEVDGYVTRISSLRDGTVMREVYDQDGDGRIDRIVSFEDGRPVAGIRDSDRDGRFEVTEQYEDGDPARLLVDLDGDGTVDYTEELLPEGEKGWDYDGDGNIDVYDSIASEDGVLRRYADGDGEPNLSMTRYRETTRYE